MNADCHEMPNLMAAPSSPDYLAQLLKDRKQMQSFSSVFIHLGRILEEEICRVRENIFQQQIISKEPLDLPEPFDQIVTLSEKLYIPVKEHPDFNFVGRILGPRGMTTKQIEQITGCKVMIRGKGSMRDRKKEELNRGKPNWEHLNEDLHVLITVEDTQNRATIRLQRAVNELRKLLVPLPEGEDDLKKLQLMELAIMNGTYRDNNSFQLVAAHNPFIMTTHPFPVSTCNQMTLPPLIRASVAGRPPGPAGAPIILAPRIPVHQLAPGTMSPIGTSTMQAQPSTPTLPPQLVPVADITSPPPYLVHFDPYIHQTASLEHMPPNVTYVR